MSMNSQGYNDYNFWSDYSFFKNDVISMSGYISEIDYSKPLFRSRTYDGFNTNDIKELKYPDKTQCKKIGRANVPNYPVFYASYTKECAVNELKLDKKKTVVVSEWKWKPDTSLVVKLFSKQEPEFEEALTNFNVRTIEKYVERAKIKGLPLTPGTFHGDMLSRMSALCDLFLNESDYFGSAIIAFEELYRTRLNSSYPNSDVLIYPSVLNSGGINVAIHPEIVDKHLDAHSVEILDVAENGDFQLKYSHRLQP